MSTASDVAVESLPSAVKRTARKWSVWSVVREYLNSCAVELSRDC